MWYGECPEYTKLIHGNICIIMMFILSSYSYSNVLKE